jgi:hypothetical protein
MVGLVVFAKVLARPVKASFHRRDAGGQDLGNFGMAPTLLDEGEQRAVLGAQLGERMAQGVKFLGAYCAGRLGDVFVLLAKWEKNPPQLLAAQLVDAGVAGESKQPRLELRRGLQVIQRPDHLDENLLGEVFDIITASGHGVNEAGHPMLVADNELMLGGFVALLSPPDKVRQRIR